MYTIVPYRSHREVSRPFGADFFGDRFFRSLLDMNDMVGAPGFRVDVKETPEAYALEAELPGVKQDQIDLSVEDDVLTISADVNTEKKEEHGAYLYSERRSGHMARSFNLDGIDQEKIRAAYKDGVLSVTLPKLAPAPEKTARKIAIEGNAAPAPVTVHQGEKAAE